MRCKTDRIKKEWSDERLDFRLRTILFAVDWYCRKHFGRNIQLTCVFRTQAEQDAIYSGNAKYKRKPWQSVHQYWRGIDVGVNAFTEEQRIELRDFINNHFEYSGRHKTCVYHNVGLGFHFHLQVDWKSITKMKCE